MKYFKKLMVFKNFIDVLPVSFLLNIKQIGKSNSHREISTQMKAKRNRFIQQVENSLDTFSNKCFVIFEIHKSDQAKTQKFSYAVLA